MESAECSLALTRVKSTCLKHAALGFDGRGCCENGDFTFCARQCHSFSRKWKARSDSRVTWQQENCRTDYNRVHFEEAAINGVPLFMILIKSVATKRALECQNGSRLFLLKTKRLEQLLKKFAARKWDE
jgi:hypothetical protein